MKDSHHNPNYAVKEMKETFLAQSISAESFYLQYVREGQECLPQRLGNGKHFSFISAVSDHMILFLPFFFKL